MQGSNGASRSGLDAGIDDIGFYGGPLTIAYDVIARTRGIPDRERQHAQFVRRSVVPPFEDPVTLAVNAARPLVEAAGAGSFGLLLVATETGLDYARPVSTYVHRHLRLPAGCRHLELKNACYAGAAALQLATAWVRSGVAPGRRALVISTDVAGRRANHPSEVTAGEGAVAISVSADPRILALDAIEGCASDYVDDLSRPRPMQEAGDPHRSLHSYLDLLDLAWDEYRRQAGGVRFEEHFRYMAYHTPLVWLVREGHRALLLGDRSDATDAYVAASFERMVRPSLRFTEVLGNVYSGSVLVALIGLLDALGADESGARVGVFSYGSGASAELFSGTVAKGARAAMAERAVGAHLAARHDLSTAEYDAAAAGVFESLTSRSFVPDRSCPAWRFDAAYEGRGRLVLESVKEFTRHYAWS
jgi:3-hydroxy-3-methylglutaryl CoA synthase